MAEDWLADVRKYASDADENVVGAIVRYLGIALRNRDSSLISFSDPVEVARVRDNFLRKKLALTEPDGMLDGGLAWVKGLMTGDRTKNRVTAYYLLAHYFGKLDLFGGSAGTSAASLAGGEGGASNAGTLAGLGAAGAALAVADDEPSAPSSPPPPTTIAAAPEATPAPSARVLQPSPTPRTTEDRPVVGSRIGAQPAYAANLDDDRDNGSGWPRWLTWLLLALAVVALIFLLRTCSAETPDTAGGSAVSQGPAVPAPPADQEIVGDAQAGLPGAAAAVPAGAGVVSGLKDSKPLLTVYFDSGKAAVSNDLAAATGALKAYLEGHPGSRLAVSGYNDPTGNAALNAELSKKRAQAVAAALATAGIPQASIELVKPDDTTTGSVTPEQARRVEVSVK